MVAISVVAIIEGKWSTQQKFVCRCLWHSAQPPLSLLFRSLEFLAPILQPALQR